MPVTKKKPAPVTPEDDPLQELNARYLDALCGRIRRAAIGPAPRTGWVRSLSEAMGMSLAELASRLGVGVAQARRLENAEVNCSISLSSLHRLAEALDSDLVYALVPRNSLSRPLRRQEPAALTACDLTETVPHGMRQALREQRKLLTQAIAQASGPYGDARKAQLERLMQQTVHEPFEARWSAASGEPRVDHERPVPRRRRSVK